jgi:ketosteroid isomerase-like protein
MSSIKEEILAANEKFMDTFRGGDFAKLASYYTENAKLLPPGSEMLIGQENIQNFWKGGSEMGIKAVKLETLEVIESDQIAVEDGRYTLTIQPDENTNVEEKGKYVVVWKFADGWKLHVDIWNSDN